MAFVEEQMPTYFRRLYEYAHDFPNKTLFNSLESNQALVPQYAVLTRFSALRSSCKRGELDSSKCSTAFLQRSLVKMAWTPNPVARVTKSPGRGHKVSLLVTAKSLPVDSVAIVKDSKKLNGVQIIRAQLM